MKVQAIDIAEWPENPEWGVFPQGARAKRAVMCPEGIEDARLIAGESYLFKLSRRVYVDQFWAEVIAYRVGLLVEVPVPPAFPAFHSGEGVCGALIQWFYQEGRESYAPAGDFLQKANPSFDRERGTAHNLHHNMIVMAEVSKRCSMETDCIGWWVKAFFFDALIGNTDRHQDNWGFIFKLDDNKQIHCRLTPAFDNGTALGFELAPERVNGWAAERVATYVDRGTHHVRLQLGGTVAERQHAEMARFVLSQFPEYRQEIVDTFGVLSLDQIRADLEQFCECDIPVPLTRGRLDLVLRLMGRRLEVLKGLL